jgi:hypothetical protein
MTKLLKKLGIGFPFAVTTDPFTSTDLAAVISETWTTIVNEKTFNETVLANFVTDLSEFATEGSDIFHVPDLFTNALTVSTQSTQGAEITTASPAQTDTTLTINTHKYVAFIIGDKDLLQIASKYNVNEMYAREAVSLLTEALEADLAALWSSLTTNAIGDTATVLSDSEIRTGIYNMENGKYKLSDCAFFFHPYVYWQQLHAVTKYYQQYSYGPSDAPGAVRTGNFGVAGYQQNFKGFLYGIPVYTTTNIVSGLQTYRNLLLHKRSFGFAVQTQNGNRVRVQTENAIRNLGMLTVVDIKYGVAVLREPAGVLLNASSAFLGS